MRIAYITSGAAGMFCGSCMRDNTLVAALGRLGHDAILIPTYTPIRTDEEDVSEHRVFFGGINVYLQQKLWFFRHTPWLVDRILDLPRLLRWVSRFAVRTEYSELGEMTVSMLKGKDGKQRKEVAKLTEWLAGEVKPDVVVFSNALLSGIVPELSRALGVPVFVTLQGDDIFLDALPESYREHSNELIRSNTESVAGFIATSRYYADYMAGYLGLERDRVHVVYPGLNLALHGGPREARREPPYTIGFFARICPEKGFHSLVDAFILLRKAPGAPHTCLRSAGWLGDNNLVYFEEQLLKLKSAGLSDDFEYVDCPGHEDKVKFLRSLDVLSVPTTYHEPKGLYILEAWANGVPVVQPRHGSFLELIEATGGGLLVEPGDPAALAAEIRRLLDDHDLRDRLARAGHAAVRDRFHADAMAKETIAVLERSVGAPPSLATAHT
jgi:glycosyltransferase involved in cell wall biosynthesis